MTSSTTRLRAENLLQRLLERAPDDARGWFEHAWGAAATGEYEAIAPVFAATARRLRGIELTRDAAMGASGAGAESLEWLGTPAGERAFRAAMFLLACDALAPEEQSDLAARLYATGDNSERCALLRAFPYVPEPQALVATAVEACRSNVADVFGAIACENPYPADWFSDAAFNQMVMKAAFSGLALARIRGLKRRRNDELSRMARDFSAERIAANRPVPPDLDLIVEGDA